MSRTAAGTRFLALFATTSIVIALSASAAAPVRAGSTGGTLKMPGLGPGGTAWQLDGRVYATLTVGDTLYVGGQPGWMYVNTGNTVQFDLATGTIRQPLAGIGGTNELPYASGPDGAGGWFVGGTELSVGGQPHGRLLHVLADGSVSSWAPSLDGDVRALIVANGVLYVAGQFGTVNGVTRRFVAAFDAKTAELLPWNPAPDGPVNALAFGNGVVVAGGWFGSIGGRAQAYLAALDPVSGSATSWSPAVSYCVNCVAVRGSSVFFGGYFTAVGGQIRHYAAAVDVATGACTGWNPDVTPPPYEMACGHIYVGVIAIDDTTVYLGGDFVAVDGLPRRGVAAVSATSGRVVATWNAGLWQYPGMCSNPGVYAIAAANGRVALGGDFFVDDATTDLLVVEARTAQPVGWNVGTYLGVGTVSIANGQLFVGGAFHRIQQWRNGLAAFDLKTGMPTPWKPSLSGVVHALAFDPVHRVLFAGGAFGPGVYPGNTNLAAYDLVHGVALPCPSADGEVDALACDGERLYVGGSFAALGDSLAPRRRLAAVRTREEGRPLDAWDPSTDGPVGAIAITGDGVVVGGAFTQVGGAARHNLAKLDVETGAALDWRPDPDGAVRALLPARDALFVGGEFAAIAGRGTPYLAALDERTGAALPFDAQPDGAVLALGASGKAVFAGGAFRNIGGAPRRSLAALFSSSGHAMPWCADADADVFALVPRADQVVVGGAFTTVAGETHHALAGVTIDDVGATGVESGVGSAPPRPTLATPSPDPVRAGARVRFALPTPRRVTLAIYDVQGRFVARLLDRATLAAGTHDVAFSARRWAPGLYLCRLRTDDGETVARRFLVVR